MKSIRVNLTLPAALKEEVREHASDQEISFAEYVRDAIKEKIWKEKQTLIRSAS